jgi:hypothetical protein
MVGFKPSIILSVSVSPVYCQFLPFLAFKNIKWESWRETEMFLDEEEFCKVSFVLQDCSKVEKEGQDKNKKAQRSCKVSGLVLRRI